MQPPAAFYSRYPSMLPPTHSAPMQQQPPAALQHQPPHYPHPQYAAVSHQPPAPQHQYVYPPTYAAQSPYLCVPSPPTPPAPQQYPVQQVHMIPPYVPRPPLQAPLQQLPVQQYVVPPKETPERDTFYAKLHAFREEIGEPIQRLPTLGFKELDLWVLYKEVIKRKGIDSVIAKKQWKEVAEALQLPSSCTDSGFRLRLHYKKYLEAFERKFYRPPPSAKDLKKDLKKLDRPSSLASVDSAITDVAGENSGSSGSRRSSGPASSSEATSKGDRRPDLKKPSAVVKKKKRSPVAQPPKTPSDAKRKLPAPPSKADDKPKKHMEERRVTMSPVTPPAPSPPQHCPVSRLDSHPSSKRERLGVLEGGVRKPASSKSVRTDRDNLSVLEAAAAALDRKRKPASRRRNKVDFSVLDNSTLKKYASVYDVAAPKEKDEGGKQQLAESISAHFSATPLRGGEHETLLRFIRAVRRG